MGTATHFRVEQLNVRRMYISRIAPTQQLRQSAIDGAGIISSVSALLLVSKQMDVASVFVFRTSSPKVGEPEMRKSVR